MKCNGSKKCGSFGGLMFKKFCAFVRDNLSLVISFVCLSICILMIAFSCSSCKSCEQIVVDDSHSVSIPC